MDTQAKTDNMCTAPGCREQAEYWLTTPQQVSWAVCQAHAEQLWLGTPHSALTRRAQA